MEIFSKIPQHVALELVTHVQMQQYPANAILHLEGKAVADWHYIVEGEALVYKAAGATTGVSAMWIDIRTCHAEVLAQMNVAREQLPSAQQVGLSKTTRAMLVTLEEAAIGTQA